MKKLFIPVLAVLGLASCSKDDDGGSVDRALLLQKWYNVSYTVDGQTYPYDDHEECGKDYLEFLSDGTFRFVDVWECVDEVDTGDWSLSGNKLTVILEGEAESATVKKLTGDTLILSVKYDFDDDGDVETIQELYTSAE